MKILYVDPLADRARRVCARLEATGGDATEVIVADRVETALAQVHATDLSLVLARLEFGEQLSQLCDATSLPVICLGPEVHCQTMRWALEQGAVHALPESLDAARLHHQLQMVSRLPVRTPVVPVPAYGDGPAQEGPVRVLLVDPDPGSEARVRVALAELPQTFTLQTAAQLAHALTLAGDQDFDLVITELALPDHDGTGVVKRLREAVPEASLVVLSHHDHARRALACIDQGADDVVSKGDASHLDVVLTRQLAWVRGDWVPAPPPPSDIAAPARYELARPVYVIPVGPGGGPDAARQSQGTTVEVGRDSLGFLLDTRLPTRRVVVGVEPTTGPVQFATVQVQRETCQGAVWRYDATLLAGTRDPLDARGLRLQLQADYRLELAAKRDLLEAWERLGVLRRVLLGRGFICPRCGALPLVRNGCKACGSARLTSSQLIHHFACAHVDHVAAFQNAGGLECPKCRAQAMIVGTDFEYLRGPYVCLDCHWNDTDFETVGNCLQCGHCFPVHQAMEEDFIGFHVERLDPMALVGPS